MSSPLRVAGTLGLMLATLSGGQGAAQPVLTGATDWQLLATVPHDNAGPPVFAGGGADLYLPVNATSGSLWRWTVDGINRRLASAAAITGAAPAEGGAVFFAQVVNGQIRRYDPVTNEIALWLASYGVGDTDPVGMTRVPATYAGGLVAPGDLLIADLGSGSPDGLYWVASRTVDGPDGGPLVTFGEVVGDDAAFVDPVDVAVRGDAIYVVDRRPADQTALWRVDDTSGLLAAQTIAPTSPDDAVALELDPVTGELIVANAGTDELLALMPSGTADGWTSRVVATGGGWGNADYAAVTISPDGARMAVASGDAVYIYGRCDATLGATIPDCDGDDRADVCETGLDGAVDCNANAIPDACERATGDVDCDEDDIIDTCPACQDVDVVFIFDTSMPNDAEGDALCAHIVGVIDAMAHRGLTVQAHLLGVSETSDRFPCLTGSVIGAFGASLPGTPPGSLTDLGGCAEGLATEDWGRAVAVVAAGMAANVGGAGPQWRPGAERLVVPISDEGPHCGDPATSPGLDRDAITFAADIARQHEVRVSPVSLSGAGVAVVDLARTLARDTRGIATHATDADAVLGGLLGAVDHACRAPTDCNGNANPDACDLTDGISTDCNGDDVPDDCQLHGDDCNLNQILDACEVQADGSDCDANGRPDSCPECPAIDALFLMDTSSSMNDEALELCAGILDVALDMARRGLTYRATYFGIDTAPGGAFSCLTDGVFQSAYGTELPGLPSAEVAAECPGSSQVRSEDWARAVAIAAVEHPWVEGAVRLIVPVADEGPWCGDPVNDIDRAATDYAIGIARGEGVLVSPIMAGGSSASVLAEGGRIAAATGGGAFALSEEITLTGSVLSSILGACDADYDCDDDDVPDSCELAAEPSLDCDANGVLDTCDIARGETDCDANLVPDACEIAADPAADCDGNGALDRCELGSGALADCNANGMLDHCDAGPAGASADVDDDDVPDECQIEDCDDNGVDDRAEIAAGVSLDCNANARPDGCDLAEAFTRDLTWTITDFSAADGGPGVVRDGPDTLGAPALEGYLGYESVADGGDPLAFTSTQGETGSPLAGDFEVDFARVGGTVAITELMNNPAGSDTNAEWLELFNYGARPVSLVGWTLQDDDDATDYPLPPVALAPGGYIILVEHAANFAARWGFDEGEIGVRIFHMGDFGALGNDVDDVSIVDDVGAVAWSLRYRNDDVSGVATTLTRQLLVLPRSVDCDGDGVPDECQADCDGSGVADVCELRDGLASDCDTDGLLDACAIAAGGADCDVDGVPDSCQEDCNDNDVADVCDVRDGTSGDCDGDGVPDECQADCDGNEIPDACDLRDGAPDCDVDGRLDRCEIADGNETDCDGGGVPDACEADCNENGVADACDIRDGAVTDCDGDGVPDGCQIAAGAADCDANGVLDVCQADCNENKVADACDLRDGTSADCNGDAQPDECQLDCDDNGIPDDCDLRDGAPDCDGNDVPDGCDVAAGAADCDGDGRPDRCQDDCDDNGVADVCDVRDEIRADCNINGVPDVCDVRDGASADCNSDGVPDECQADCDDNGVPDDCDLSSGAPDCDDDGRLDRCELASGDETDCNEDGIPDACQDTTEVCDGVDNDCDGLTDVADPDLVLVACGAGCPAGMMASADLCVAGSWRPCDCVPDLDRDGVPDADDNCPEVANRDQQDSDDNGVGDACDEVDGGVIAQGGGGCGGGADPSGGWLTVPLLAVWWRRRATRLRAMSA